MPYIHPDLGVPCMTQTEFWQNEAKNSGEDAYQLMDDFYSQIADEEKTERQKILDNKEDALNQLLDYYDPAYCDDLEFIPVEVIKILDANVSIGLKKQISNFVAEVRCDDDKIRTLEYTETHYSGSYLEPPEFDFDCQEVK